ncbi:MAG: hypothetical protein ACOCP8_01300 [archaeon]
MIFWSIILWSYQLLILIDRKIFTRQFENVLENTVKIKEIEEEMNDDKIEKYRKKQEVEQLARNNILLLASGLLFVLAIAGIKFIYFIVAIQYDPLKLPTLILLFSSIISTVFNIKNATKNFNNTNNDNLEELRSSVLQAKEKIHKRNFKSTAWGICHYIYFSYMLYIFIF